MTYLTTFAPAASVTLNPIEQAGGFGLPAVDAGNADVVVTASGGAPTYFAFGAGVMQSPPAVGTLTVGVGQALLFTTNPKVLAATAGNPNVIPITQANATVIQLMTNMRGATVTIVRGTASSQLIF